MPFTKQSYRAHASHPVSNNLDKMIYQDWFQKNTTDLWRHQRMLNCLDPFLQTFPGASWLTVGDGSFGTSATYIQQHGGVCLCTDINTTQLEQAYSLGWIGDYKQENAEQLSFSDDTFDFTFCKEAFHHFPRPYIALYELLRVSKKAVILSEPADWIPGPILKQIAVQGKAIIKKIVGKSDLHIDATNFESIGNYIFTISVREFEKIGIAMGLPYLAYKHFHDVYYPGVESEPAKWSSPLFRKIRFKIATQKMLALTGLSSMNRISIVLFKAEPDTSILAKLKPQFKVSALPQSPIFSRLDD